jgi:hypothetical protein
MSKIEHLGRPPPGWFVVDVMRSEARKRDWVALMIDVPLDEYRRGRRTMKRNVFVRIPGKHRNRDAAYDALEGLMATRH